MPEYDVDPIVSKCPTNPLRRLPVILRGSQPPCRRREIPSGSILEIQGLRIFPAITMDIQVFRNTCKYR